MNMLLLLIIQELMVLLQTGVKLKTNEQIWLFPLQLLLEQPPNWFLLLQFLSHCNPSSLQTS